MIGVATGIAFHGSNVFFYSVILILGSTALLVTVIPYFKRDAQRELGNARVLRKYRVFQVAEGALSFLALVLIGLSVATVTTWVIL